VEYKEVRPVALRAKSMNLKFEKTSAREVNMLLQILIAGIVVGSCYAVVSVGMTILFQATTILNFGHGECVMIGAFLFYTLQTLLGINYFLAIAITILAAFIIGALMDRLVFRPIVHAPHVNVVLATCGFLYLYKGAARMIWKSEPRFPPPFFEGAPVQVLAQSLLFRTLLSYALFLSWVHFLYGCSYLLTLD